MNDSRLITLQIVSIILATIAAAAIIILTSLIFDFDEASTSESGGEVLGLLILFILYFVVSTVVVYINYMITFIVLKKIENINVSLSEAMGSANSKLGTIMGYALIAATVGVILNILQNASRNSDKPAARIAGSIANALGGAAWSIATFLVIPVLVMNNVGPIDAIKQSLALFKKTWGEQIIGGFAYGLIIFIVALPAFIISFLIIISGVSAESSGTTGLGIFLLTITIIIAALVSSAISTIYKSILFKFATEGKIAEGFDESMIKNL